MTRADATVQRLHVAADLAADVVIELDAKQAHYLKNVLRLEARAPGTSTPAYAPDEVSRTGCSASLVLTSPRRDGKPSAKALVAANVSTRRAAPRNAE